MTGLAVKLVCDLVDIVTQVQKCGELTAHFIDLIKVNIGVNYLLGLVTGGDDLTEGVGNGGVSPALVVKSLIAGSLRTDIVYLIIHSSGPYGQLPMLGAGCHVKLRRADNDLCSAACHGTHELGKTHVKAD